MSIVQNLYVLNTKVKHGNRRMLQLIFKTRSNMKYCSICRNAENIIIHQHGYRDVKDWDCYCVRFLPDLFYGKYSKIC